MAKRYWNVAVMVMRMFGKQGAWFIPHTITTVLITERSVSQKAVEIDGHFFSREPLSITASFSFDHNIVDREPTSRFMNQFAETVKNILI